MVSIRVIVKVRDSAGSSHRIAIGRNRIRRLGQPPVDAAPEHYIASEYDAVVVVFVIIS